MRSELLCNEGVHNDGVDGKASRDELHFVVSCCKGKVNGERRTLSYTAPDVSSREQALPGHSVRLDRDWQHEIPVKNPEITCR